MRKLLSSFLFSFSLAVAAIASPVKANIGGVDVERMSLPESGEIPYVPEGLVFWWDGMEGEWDGSDWVDLISGEKMLRSPRGEDYAGVATVPAGYASGITALNKKASGDFTLHCLLETCAKSSWQNWCQIGFGRAAGLENGFTLFGEGLPMKVVYRTAYAAAPVNSIPLAGVVYGDMIALDIVFHYETLVFEVFVNGQFVGGSQILESDYNLDGKNDLGIGTYFYKQGEVNSNVKRFVVLFYNRALTEEEIVYNYLIDKERFGL